eukprot:CAMPEP_0197491286 /NCGR_PEP_ID=MMETSP1311-20131121/5596_1 /TAXON_ID=464262 /ORGANISM="Genus nov. species nov., Strain RCC856" /LENGTH=34 /DNA_ID= /DNA_START= /DNA_END= /DNA_ORIENTATION=
MVAAMKSLKRVASFVSPLRKVRAMSCVVTTQGLD